MRDATHHRRRDATRRCRHGRSDRVSSATDPVASGGWRLATAAAGDRGDGGSHRHWGPGGSDPRDRTGLAGRCAGGAERPTGGRRAGRCDRARDRARGGRLHRVRHDVRPEHEPSVPEPPRPDVRGSDSPDGATERRRRGLSSRFVSDAETFEQVTISLIDSGTMQLVEFASALVAVWLLQPSAVVVILPALACIWFVTRRTQEPAAAAGQRRQEELEAMTHLDHARTRSSRRSAAHRAASAMLPSA